MTNEDNDPKDDDKSITWATYKPEILARGVELVARRLRQHWGLDDPDDEKKNNTPVWELPAPHGADRASSIILMQDLANELRGKAKS